jgi:hypothetical protein
MMKLGNGYSHRISLPTAQTDTAIALTFQSAIIALDIHHLGHYYSPFRFNDKRAA